MEDSGLQGGFQAAKTELGLGTYNFMGIREFEGQVFGWPDRSRDLMRRLVDLSVHRGIRLIDTADFYGFGDVERFLHELDLPSSILVSTKGGKTGIDVKQNKLSSDFSEEHIRFAVNRSLKNLGRDRLDVYFLHGPTLSDLNDLRCWDLLKGLQRDGIIGTLGLSPKRSGMYDDDYVDAIMRLECLDIVQIPFSLSNQTHHVVASKLQREGKTLIARGVFGHGLFFKRHDFSDVDPSDPRRGLYIESDKLGASAAIELRQTIRELKNGIGFRNLAEATDCQFLIVVLKSLGLFRYVLVGASTCAQLEELLDADRFEDLDVDQLKAVKDAISVM